MDPIIIKIPIVLELQIETRTIEDEAEPPHITKVLDKKANSYMNTLIKKLYTKPPKNLVNIASIDGSESKEVDKSNRKLLKVTKAHKTGVVEKVQKVMKKALLEGKTFSQAFKDIHGYPSTKAYKDIATELGWKDPAAPGKEKPVKSSKPRKYTKHKKGMTLKEFDARQEKRENNNLCPCGKALHHMGRCFGPLKGHVKKDSSEKKKRHLNAADDPEYAAKLAKENEYVKNSYDK